MQKVISLFKRDYEGTRLVYNELVDGAEWVINGEGVATEKIDGTSVLIKSGAMFKRYDCKKGKQPPLDFIPAQEPDPVTGHWPGWIPVDCARPENKWHCSVDTAGLADGTYELIGKKIQGNPYGLSGHQLRKHGDVILSTPRDFEGLKVYFAEHPNFEGIVWHHPDGRMVKIKRRDFGLKWPTQGS